VLFFREGGRDGVGVVGVCCCFLLLFTRFAGSGMRRSWWAVMRSKGRDMMTLDEGNDYGDLFFSIYLMTRLLAVVWCAVSGVGVGIVGAGDWRGSGGWIGGNAWRSSFLDGFLFMKPFCHGFVRVVVLLCLCQ